MFELYNLECPKCGKIFKSMINKITECPDCNDQSEHLYLYADLYYYRNPETDLLFLKLIGVNIHFFIYSQNIEVRTPITAIRFNEKMITVDTRFKKNISVFGFTRTDLMRKIKTMKLLNLTEEKNNKEECPQCGENYDRSDEKSNCCENCGLTYEEMQSDYWAGILLDRDAPHGFASTFEICSNCGEEIDSTNETQFCCPACGDFPDRYYGEDLIDPCDEDLIDHPDFPQNMLKPGPMSGNNYEIDEDLVY